MCFNLPSFSTFLCFLCLTSSVRRESGFRYGNLNVQWFGLFCMGEGQGVTSAGGGGTRRMFHMTSAVCAINN